MTSSTTSDAAAAHEQRLTPLRCAASGEEVITAESGTPLARFVALPLMEAKPEKRVDGQLAGRGFWIADDFDAPLPPDLLDAFGSGAGVPANAERAAISLQAGMKRG